MRVTLNNTAVFAGQARGIASALLLAAIVLPGGAAAIARNRRRPGRRPPRRRISPRCARRRRRPRRCLRPPTCRRPPGAAGSLRVHLDAEPTTLLPLADADASTAQVTNGLIYETLLDCRDGTYRPGLAESWDVSNDGMRIAVRVRGGVHWHDHRVFGVIDVQATLEPLMRNGTDAPVAARRAGRRRVDRARDRADRAVRAEAAVRPGAARAVRRADPARPPGARRAPGVVVHRAIADRHRAVPLRRLGARQAHPPRARARILGAGRRRRRDRLRPGSRRGSGAQPHAARRDRRAPARASTRTTRTRSSRRRCTGPASCCACARDGIRSWPSTTSATRWRIRGSAARWPGCGTARASPTSCTTTWRTPIGGPPLAEDIPAPPFDRKRAAVRAGRRRLPRHRRRRRARSPGAARSACRCWSRGQPLFHVEAHAFALEARKVGVLIDLIPADAATILQRLKRGDFELAPMIWEGRPTRTRSRSTAPTAPSTSAATGRRRWTR